MLKLKLMHTVGGNVLGVCMRMAVYVRMDLCSPPTLPFVSSFFCLEEGLTDVLLTMFKCVRRRAGRVLCAIVSHEDSACRCRWELDDSERSFHTYRQVRTSILLSAVGCRTHYIRLSHDLSPKSVLNMAGSFRKTS